MPIQRGTLAGERKVGLDLVGHAASGQQFGFAELLVRMIDQHDQPFARVELRELVHPVDQVLLVVLLVAVHIVALDPVGVQQLLLEQLIGRVEIVRVVLELRLQVDGFRLPSVGPSGESTVG